MGALENVQIIEPKYLYQYQNGHTKITVHRDIERLKDELLVISPVDEEQITEFVDYIQALQSMSMPLEPMDQMKMTELIKLGKSMMKIGKIIKKTSNISVGEYASRFKKIYSILYA